MKKLVLFGAGKIGRSFIGQLFSRAGYEIIFIDKDSLVIDALNHQKSYNVIICGDNPETLHIENVRGILSSETDKIYDAIAEADIMAISIGKNGLSDIVHVLTEGFLQREADYPGKGLDIIIAENMRNVAQYLYHELKEKLPASYPLRERIGLIETSIGKMVPFVENSGKDILTVHAETYNTLIVDKDAFINPVPPVPGLDAKTNMKAWVDRKLFIHNLGHASAAYLGYSQYPDKIYLWELLEDDRLNSQVRQTMTESAVALRYLYPDIFTVTQLQEHIDDLLRRFRNKSLGDTVFRVGCDLYRKLSPDDRLVTPLMCAYNAGLPYRNIFFVLDAAIHFKAKDAKNKMFPSDILFHQKLNEIGKENMLKKVCELPDELVSNQGVVL